MTGPGEQFEANRNLWFGLIALQAELISEPQFIEACRICAEQKSASLEEIISARGWLTPADRDVVQRLIVRRLSGSASFEGDPGPTETAMMDEGAGPNVTGFVLSENGGVSPRPAGRDRERYALKRLHARGGIGQVWIALDKALGREVALKEPRPEQALSAAIVDRFLEEARIAGQLEHPGIVPVYELIEGESPFYTMRFVHGRTLWDAIRVYHAGRARGQESLVEQLRLLNAFVTVCNVLAYAHSRGVVHRDIKGQNVILGDYGEVIVLDWGLAKMIGTEGSVTSRSLENAGSRSEHVASDSAPSGEVVAAFKEPPSAGAAGVTDASDRLTGEARSRSRTIQGQVMGTPAYMAPEQAAGRADLIDARTDVYGLGALLYEILTGKAPFTATDSMEVLRQVREEIPRPPRELVPTVARPLEAICLKAVAKSRDERYPSAAGLASDVQKWLADEPVSVYPEPWVARTGRWMRRHRTTVSGAATALIVAALSLSVLAGVLIRANQRERQAKDLAQASEKLAQQERDEAQRQRDKAEKRYSLARRAVDRYQSLSEASDLKAHGLESLRSGLLEAALDFYKQFLNDESSDVQVLSDRGLTFMKLGNLYRIMGKNDSAEKAYEEALAVQLRLCREHPRIDQYTHEMSRTLSNLGNLLSATGRREAAEAAYRRAQAIQRELLTQHPDVRAYQQALSASDQSLGDLYYSSGRFSDAEARFQEALTLESRLIDSFPDDASYQEQLGSIHNCLGNVYIETKRIDEAESAYRSALGIQEALARAQPDLPDYQQRLAGTYNNLGLLYRGRRRWMEADSSVKKAVAIRERLADGHPDVIAYASDLSSGYCNLGHIVRDTGHPQEALGWYNRAIDRLSQVLKKEARDTSARRIAADAFRSRALVLVRLGKHGEAIADWDQAIVFNEESFRSILRSMRAESLAHSGRYREAVTEAKELSRQPPPGKNACYNLACICAVAAVAAAEDPKAPAATRQAISNRYQEESLALLRRAQADGLFKERATVDFLEKDSDLAPLRTRADFQAWLKSVRAALP
jgi:serine/threonine protein kinase